MDKKPANVLKKRSGPANGPHSKIKKSVKALWIIFLSLLILFPLLIIAINHGLVGYMPSLTELENPQSAVSSDVYAADGTLLGRYYVQDRSNCKYSEISPNIINALVATEDARFYDHAGIDPIATLRVIFRLGHAGGGSTISQQLAKNLFPRQTKNILTLPFIKLKEWVLAVKLERNLTKNEIITLYLNTVPFGDNVYGIRNAALTFYNKTPDKINVDEAAVLVGMLKGNTIYNPRSHPKNAMQRRNTVLDQMRKYNYLTDAQADELKAKETPLNYHHIDYHDGVAPYFRQIVEQQVKQIFKDPNLKKPDGMPYDIYKDGLKIYTTIDVRMQRYAEEAMEEHLTQLQKTFLAQNGYKDGSVWKKTGPIQTILTNAIKTSERYQNFRTVGDMNELQAMAQMRVPIKMRVFAWNKNHYKDTVMSPVDSIKYMKLFLQSGLMAMDPYTGEVRAWVGGIDHSYFQFDHVNQNTKRQVGSTIKPLLYCFAVDNGFSPCGMVSADPQMFPTMTHPYNADYNSSGGEMTMKRALALSINNAALYILKQVGIEAFIDFAHKCGIVSRMDPYPSVALGVSDISLYEMMGAYSMFPSGGMNTQPFFITRIEDKNGMLIKNFAPVQKEVINANTAYKMIKLMRGVVNFGTGARMRFRYGLQNDIAGKTGTTSNQADAWFIGYTPQLLTGIWVGCEDREFRFRSEALGQGAAAALPIWALFMKRVYADKNLNINPAATFKAPAGFDDCDKTDSTDSQDKAPATDQDPMEGVPTNTSDTE